MSLTERKREILRAVIEQHVETAEPVGSKTIAAAIAPAISPATIRNEMAELESLGLLEQPHTSSGRIPTAQGYRIYVDELMRRHRLTEAETAAINSALKTHASEPGRVPQEAGSLASRLTNYPAYALAATARPATILRFDLICVDSSTFIIVALMSNDAVKNKLARVTVPVDQMMLTRLATVFNTHFTGITEDRITPTLISSVERATGDVTGVATAIAGFAIELLSEAKTGRAHVTGAVNIFEYPEYRDIDKAQSLIRYLSDDRELLKLPTPDSGGETKITIGPENLASELRDSSVVVARYDIGDDMQGLIGVVGPTRMDYGKVAARLKYIARGLGWMLSGGDVQRPMGDMKINDGLGDDDIGESE